MGTLPKHETITNIVLPRPPKPVANYIPGVKVGEILYVSGTIGTVPGPNDEDILPYKGKLGKELSIEVNPMPGSESFFLDSGLQRERANRYLAK